MLYIMCVKKPIKDRFDDSIFWLFTALTLILLLGDCTMRKIAFFLQNLNWFLKSICSYVSYCHHFGQTLLTYRVLLSIEKKNILLKSQNPLQQNLKLSLNLTLLILFSHLKDLEIWISLCCSTHLYQLLNPQNFMKSHIHHIHDIMVCYITSYFVFFGNK